MTKLRELIRQLDETGMPYEIQRRLLNGSSEYVVRIKHSSTETWRFIREAPTLKGAICGVLADRDFALNPNSFRYLRDMRPGIDAMWKETMDGIARSVLHEATAGVQAKTNQPQGASYPVDPPPAPPVRFMPCHDSPTPKMSGDSEIRSIPTGCE